jgi:carboxypeptidase T
MMYLNVDEVETALIIAASTHPGVTELIALPDPTWEGRLCHALKIGRPSGAAKPAVFLLGGVHARVGKRGHPRQRHRPGADGL